MMGATNVLQVRFGVDASDLPDQRGVRSVPFEAHLCLAEECEHEEVTRLTERLLQLWLASRQRVPNAAKQQQFAACVRLIVLNLLWAEARSEGMAVGISTSKQQLAASRRYNPPFMSVDYFLKARDLLLEHGIMFIAAPGYQNGGLAQVARYRLTDAAREQLRTGAPPLQSYEVSGDKETVILKDKDGYQPVRFLRRWVRPQKKTDNGARVP